MKVKALKAFNYVDSSGASMKVVSGFIIEVPKETAELWISEGCAEGVK